MVMSLYEAAGERGHDSSTSMREAEFVAGTTAFRQAGALAEVADSGFVGATWAEVAAARGWHHGQATSALSHLHHKGLISRLDETRNRSGIYVLPEHVGDRPTVKQGRMYDSAALARDVPLPILQEALRLATMPPPNERTRSESGAGRTGNDG